MGAEIRIYTIGNAWALMPSAHGSFVNNGNVDLYRQQQSGGHGRYLDGRDLRTLV